MHRQRQRPERCGQGLDRQEGPAPGRPEGALRHLDSGLLAPERGENRFPVSEGTQLVKNLSGPPWETHTCHGQPSPSLSVLTGLGTMVATPSEGGPSLAVHSLPTTWSLRCHPAAGAHGGPTWPGPSLSECCGSPTSWSPDWAGCGLNGPDYQITAGLMAEIRRKYARRPG